MFAGVVFYVTLLYKWASQSTQQNSNSLKIVEIVSDSHHLVRLFALDAEFGNEVLAQCKRVVRFYVCNLVDFLGRFYNFIVLRNAEFLVV